MMELLSADISKLKKCVCIQCKDPHLAAIEKADLLFSNTFVTLRNYCSVMAMQTSDDEISAAAAIVASVIHSIDWHLNRRSIASELSGARAITDQMSTFENSEALIRCNASTWYLNFTEAYSDLESLHISCIDNLTFNFSDSPDLKCTKHSTIQTIEQIYSYCSILDNLNNTVIAVLKTKIDVLLVKLLSSVRIQKNISADKTEARI